MDIILLSTADWDNPFWTNKQHTAKVLGEMGFHVFYIDSLGLRAPSLKKKDFNRIINKIKKIFLAPKLKSKNVWVWSPILIPWQKFNLVRKINRKVLNFLLRFWLRQRKINLEVLWTYNPLSLELLDTEKFDVLVYHCVDDIKAQPGMPIDIIAKAEQELTTLADIVFVTSVHLYETRVLWNKNTFYYPNVVDYDHFSKALKFYELPKDIADIPHPRIGFIGALSGYKVDFHLIRYISDSRPDWEIVLIGEIGEGDPLTDPELISGRPNIHLIGPKLYKDLPAYLSGIDVAILPNTLNDYTRSMFPMKFFEYLAAGRPVVSVDLPALQDYKGYGYFAKSYDDFIEAIQLSLSNQVVPLEKRLKIAFENTYCGRTKKMIDQVSKISTSGK